MTSAEMTPEDLALDQQWRAKFGQPLPMIGASEIVRRILATTPASEQTKAL